MQLPSTIVFQKHFRGKSTPCHYEDHRHTEIGTHKFLLLLVRSRDLYSRGDENKAADSDQKPLIKDEPLDSRKKAVPEGFSRICRCGELRAWRVRVQSCWGRWENLSAFLSSFFAFLLFRERLLISRKAFGHRDCAAELRGWRWRHLGSETRGNIPATGWGNM